MVQTIQQRLVAPTREALWLEATLLLVRANAHGQTGLLTTLPGFDEWAADPGASEGWRQWNGPDPPAPHPRTVLAAAWWTDARGRVHVLLRARRGPFGESELRCTFTWDGQPPRPPFLEIVYPETVFLKKASDPPGLVRVYCACGAAGAPAALGWMGEVCGACHDRAAAGLPPPDPPVWTGPLPWGEDLALSTAARYVAGGADRDLVVTDRESGRELGRGRLPGKLDRVGGLRFHPVHPWLATASRGPDGLLLWDAPALQVRVRYEKAHNVFGIEFSADGALLRAFNNGRWTVWEVETGRRVATYDSEPDPETFAQPELVRLCRKEFMFGRHTLLPTPDGTAVGVASVVARRLAVWPAERFARLWG